MFDSYLYQTQVEWTGRRAGRLAADGMPAIFISAPPDFSGEPGNWTPEHLIVAATGGCLMMTFLSIAERSGLAVRSYRSRAFGRLEKIPGEGYRFTEITLAPEIGVAGADLEKAQKVLSKAEKNCFLSNSLRASVQLEPRWLFAAAGAAQ